MLGPDDFFRGCFSSFTEAEERSLHLRRLAWLAHLRPVSLAEEQLLGFHTARWVLVAELEPHGQLEVRLHVPDAQLQLRVATAHGGHFELQ